MDDTSLEEIAKGLQHFINSVRDETGYCGDLDIVCHSMGTCIARYLLEVIDGRGEEGESPAAYRHRAAE